MNKYEFNENDAMSAGESTGSKVLDTGVYTVKILTASKVIASTGTEGFDWSIKAEGSKYPNMVYGMWTYKANGDKIFNADIVQSLMGLIGANKLTEYEKTIEVKGGKKTVTAYRELDNVDCQVAIQKSLDIYNGEVTEKNKIKAFFNLDGQTYAESVKKAEAKQIEYYKNTMKDEETSAYKKFEVDTEEKEEDEDAPLL